MSKLSSRATTTPTATVARPFAGLERLQPHAAGADIGAHELFVCVPGPDDTQIVRAFGSYTTDLEALVEEFRQARQETYARLAREVETALKRASTARRPKGTRAPAMRRLLDIFRERVVSAEKIDFFGSAGRDRVVTMLHQFEERVSGPKR